MRNRWSPTVSSRSKATAHGKPGHIARQRSGGGNVRPARGRRGPAAHRPAGGSRTASVAQMAEAFCDRTDRVGAADGPGLPRCGRCSQGAALAAAHAAIRRSGRRAAGRRAHAATTRKTGQLAASPRASGSRPGFACRLVPVRRRSGHLRNGAQCRAADSDTAGRESASCLTKHQLAPAPVRRVTRNSVSSSRKRCAASSRGHGSQGTPP